MSLAAKAERNRRLPCRVEGCPAGRAPLSPYCGRHAKAVERHGHPEGRYADPKRDYGAERQLVEAFLSKHLDHEGVRSALSWLQTWLDSAAAGQAVAGQREMVRLSEHQVEPLSILVEAAALFLFSRWSPRKLPDDERLTYAIGHRVLSLAPREKRYGTLKGKSRYYCRRLGKVARREVGRRIRLTLALLLANIAEAISAQEDQQQQFALSLSKPFSQH